MMATTKKRKKPQKGQPIIPLGPDESDEDASVEVLLATIEKEIADRKAEDQGRPT